MLQDPKTKNTIMGALIIILTVLVFFGWFRFAKLISHIKSQEEIVKALEEKVRLYETDIAAREEEKHRLESELSANEAEVNKLNEDFEEVTETVDKLEKLSKTDKELLQKYSKVYFLNEHYIPSNLSTIDEKYLSNTKVKTQIHAKVYPTFKNMIKAADNDDVELRIISAYRSFAEQTSLKSTYKVYYGSGANAFSADQGFSEHQLGTTLDFTTDVLEANFESFEGTKAYKWLEENAYKYGFVLSYSKGNAYYVFEPWHWRFVGIKLAKKLHTDNKSFYDLDQREIDKYLISIFD